MYVTLLTHLKKASFAVVTFVKSAMYENRTADLALHKYDKIHSYKNIKIVCTRQVS